MIQRTTALQPWKVQPSLVEIGEDLRLQFSQARYYLKERERYIFEFEHADRLLINGREKPPLVPGTHLFEVCIVDNLGLTSLQPAYNGASGEKIWLEVYAAHKFTPAEHFDFYQGLVNDLFRQAANLPFCFKSDTQRGVAESTRPPTPLFTYYFLKANLDSFSAAIETVLAEPHRQLCDDPAMVPLAEVTEVDGDVILRILQSPETWVESSNFALSRALQVNGRRYAPERVWQRLPDETFNTPENRFLLHFLRQVLAAAEMLSKESWWPTVEHPNHRAVADLTALLRQTVTHPMFDEVDEMVHMPFNSQVLMRREGYRDLFALWQQFHSARSALFDTWQQAIDMRKMHHLYEMWVFFELIDQAGECETLNIPISDSQGLAYSAQAVFEDGAQLFYNQTFKPSCRSFYSYSMVLRPDFTWIDAAGSRKVVLDAKFRMTVDERELEIEDDEVTTSRTATPLRDDLYKMHTYRDALVGVQAAVVLYPGTLPIFMPVNGIRTHDVTLRNVLFGSLEGIGALCFTPGNSTPH